MPSSPFLFEIVIKYSPDGTDLGSSSRISDLPLMIVPFHKVEIKVPKLLCRLMLTS